MQKILEEYYDKTTEQLQAYTQYEKYCKSTKFGVLFNLADLTLVQKLSRII